VVLAAGVLYWFWSHIQLTQKKVQLLENAVFELRGMMTGGPGLDTPAHASAEEVAPVYNDLADDEAEGGDWEKLPSPPSPQTPGSTSLEALASDTTDLQPGGRAIGIDLTVSEQEEPKAENQFRELFIQHEQRVPTPVTSKEVSAKEVSTEQSLESMPVKELRRLAEQRGLTGVSDLKKKELLSALRQQIAPQASPQKEEVKEEEVTLDLTEDATVLE
jgi:hypothetical protein